MKMTEHFDKLKVKVNSLSKVERVEDYLVSECEKRGINLSHDTMAEEPLEFKSIGYGFCAGSIIAYPQSTQAYNAYLIEAMRKSTDSKDYSDMFSNPIDKYTAKKKFKIKKIDKLVVLPGTNILRSLVDKNILLRLAKEKAYAKVHPIMNKEDTKIMKSIFKDRLIGAEYSLYDVFNVADSIYTTTASESAIYATMNDKNLYSIEEDGHNFRGAYSPIINTLFWAKNKQDRRNTFNTLCNSSISNVFNPKDDYEIKINNFLDSLGDRCQQR
jgi:hypothetical protein